MDALEVAFEIVQTWPLLIFRFASSNQTSVFLDPGRASYKFRVFTLHMPIQVVGCGKSFIPIASWDLAFKWLRMPKLMLPTLY